MVSNEKSLAGEASSNQARRELLPTIIEDEEDEEVTSILVCCNADTIRIPIFKCDDGHITCSYCCTELRNKCKSCNLPIGNYRCQVMETIVEDFIVPCPNAEQGCTKKFTYDKELLAHEKECCFSLCHCPAQNCNYMGVYTNLYSHYYANHKEAWNQIGCGNPGVAVPISIREMVLVFQIGRDGPLVVLQSFKETEGVYVNVNCIAPSAPGVGEFSYNLSCSIPGNNMMLTFSKMNRTKKLSFQTPEKEFLLVPYYFLDHQLYGAILKMKIFKQAKKDEDEDEPDEEVVDEDEADEEDIEADGEVVDEDEADEEDIEADEEDIEADGEVVDEDEADEEDIAEEE